jgi:RND superfamily putative drug exporter
MYGVGAVCFRHRWRVIAVWLILLIAAGVGMKVASAQLDNTFTIPGSESNSALQQVKAEFPSAGGTSAQLVFQARDGSTLQSPANTAAINSLLTKAATAPQVAAVLSPQQTGAVTADGLTSIATVQYPVPTAGLNTDTLSTLADLSHSAQTPTLLIEVGGPAFSGASSSSLSTTVLGLAIALLILTIALCSLLAAGMPLISALAGVGLSMLTLKGLAAVFSISSTAQSISTMIGLAVGVDYALFILSRHRSQLAAGMEPAESAALAVGTAGSAVVFAGTTVVIALAALSVVGIPFLTVMGLSAAGTVIGAVLLANTLLPAIFGVAHNRLTPKPGSRAARLATRTAHAAQEPDGLKPTLGDRWLAGVVKRPVLALGAVVIFLLILAVPALKLELSLPDNGSSASGSDQRTTYDTISNSFGPGYNGPLLVLATLSATDIAGAQQQAASVATTLKTTKGVVAVTPPRLSADNKTALIQVVPSSAPSAVATEDVVTAIRDRESAITQSTGARIGVTGSTATGVDVSSRLSSALVPFGAIVVGLSILLLLVVFRSLVVPLKAAVGFLLSVAASFGAVTAVFQWGWLSGLFGVQKTGPIACFLPIILIAVLFGLAMDYEVFLVSRIREYYTRTGNATQAIIVGGGAAARVVTAAALIMTSIFSSFVMSDSAIIKPIAFSLAVGVACDALLVRMTAVPAVLALTQTWAWRLPSWLDRALPNLDIEGASLQPQPAPQPASVGVGARVGQHEAV